MSARPGDLASEVEDARVDGLVPVATVAELAHRRALLLRPSSGTPGVLAPVEVIGSGTHRRLRLARVSPSGGVTAAVSLPDPVGGTAFLRACSPGTSTASAHRSAGASTVLELLAVVVERLTTPAWSSVVPAATASLDRVLRGLDASPLEGSGLLSDGEEPAEHEVSYLDLALSGVPSEWALRRLGLRDLRSSVAAVGR